MRDLPAARTGLRRSICRSACRRNWSSSAQTCARRRNNCTRPARRSASPQPTRCRTSPSAPTAATQRRVFAALISPQSLAWELAGNATQTIFDAGHLAAPARGRARHLPGRGVDLSRHGDRRSAERRRCAARAAKRRRCAARRARLRACRQEKFRSGATAIRQRPEPTCCCSSRRSRLICRRASRWCRRKRRGSPTPPLIPGAWRRLVEPDRAAGGKDTSMSARARRSRFNGTPSRNDPALQSVWLQADDQTLDSISRWVSCGAACSWALFCSMISSRRAMF